MLENALGGRLLYLNQALVEVCMLPWTCTIWTQIVSFLKEPVSASPWAFLLPRGFAAVLFFGLLGVILSSVIMQSGECSVL